MGLVECAKLESWRDLATLIRTCVLFVYLPDCDWDLDVQQGSCEREQAAMANQERAQLFCQDMSDGFTTGGIGGIGGVVGICAFD